MHERVPKPLPKRILVTGGTGFIGGHLCSRLLVRGHELSILDLHPGGDATSSARFIRGDVRDAAAVADAMAGCDAVLHLAAAHHDAGIAEQTYFDVNVDSTEVIVKEMARRGLRRLCFYSSAAIYGGGTQARSEESPALPDSPYGRSKWEAEKVLQKAVSSEQVDALIIRPSVTFGPNNFANMYSLIRQIDSGLFVQVGAGENIKSLSYVENLSDFTLWAWSRHSEGSDVFNWVESPDLTSREIAAHLAKAMGRTPPSLQVPLNLALLLALPFEIAARVLGRPLPISRARVRKLSSDQTQFSARKAYSHGFEPDVSIEEAFRRTVRWYEDIGRLSERIMRLPPDRV